jgi:predicted nucleic acid-binding protein
MTTAAVDQLFVDTNVLLTASTPARHLHAAAVAVLSQWPDRGIELCLSGQVLREYIVVATRPIDVGGLGLALREALHNIDQITARTRLLEEDAAVHKQLLELLVSNLASGKQVHDAGIVATALRHHIPALLTENTRHFQRFEQEIALINLTQATGSVKAGSPVGRDRQ